MKRSYLAVISLLAAGLQAQQPPAPTAAQVGSINSQSPVEINGTPMRPDGAPFWPIVSGDSISVGQSPAFFKLADQNRIEFAPGSQADIRRLTDGRVFVFLRSGDAKFTVSPATLALCAANTLFVPRAASTGDVDVLSNNRPDLRTAHGTVAKYGAGSCDERGLLLQTSAVPASIVGPSATPALIVSIGVAAGAVALTTALTGFPEPRAATPVTPSQP